MKTPVLETERLILRPISLDDAPAIQKHFNNWNIIQYLTPEVPWPYPEDGAETFIRDNVLPRVQSGDSFVWIIVSKEDSDEAIGIIDWGKRKTNDANCGFWLGEEFWGRGLMTEARIAVNDFVFFELGIERFKVINVVNNLASHRIQEKTGAQLIGMEKLLHHNGESASEIWEVTKENWEKIRKS